jgi:hypothetical protein
MFLSQLCGLAPPSLSTAEDRLPRSVVELVDSWAETPAFVHDRRLEVLHANELASTLFYTHAKGTNLLRAVFLDPGYRRLRPDWETVAEEAVAGLRALNGAQTSDTELQELITELSERSSLFRSIWSRYEVRVHSGRPCLVLHPRAGRIELRYTRLAVSGIPGLTVIVYHAAPGSPAASALRALRENSPPAVGSPGHPGSSSGTKPSTLSRATSS